MRLIDADKLMDSLRGNVLVDVTPDIEEAVSEQPTAYDVDQVVEQLEKMRDTAVQNIALNSQSHDIENEIESKGKCYTEIIEIVKAGGVG